MNGKQLKNSILQWAIQGRLVPQDPNDEPASVLLWRIQAEKAKLVKEGKLKKTALNDSTIFRGEDNKYYEKVGKTITCIDEDIPFEIPEGWEWVRIGTVFAHNNGKQLNKSNSRGKLMEYITTSNLYWDGFKLEGLKKMPFEEYEIERCQALKGDLLVCEGGDVGRSCIWPYDTPIMLQNHIHKLRAYYPVCTKYFFYVLYEFNLSGRIGGKGIGIQGFSSNALHNTYIPLPPLAEQRRIVAKVEEVLSVVERYEKAQDALDALCNSLDGRLRKSILSEAIRGHLVPQDPTDEPASLLLRRIQAEKAKLVKEGKLKKSALSDSRIFRGEDNKYYEKNGKTISCIDKDIPFEIPETWEWVRLGSVVSVQGGKRMPAGRKLTSENTGHYYIRVSDMKDGNVSTDDLHFVPEDIYPSISKYIIKKEDVYITVAGTIGRVGKIPPELDGANLTENADRLSFTHINQDWLISALQSFFVQEQIIFITTKVGQPKLAIERIGKLLLPLPPLAEQHRIVSKVEELFAVLDRLACK